MVRLDCPAALTSKRGRWYIEALVNARSLAGDKVPAGGPLVREPILTHLEDEEPEDRGFAAPPEPDNERDLRPQWMRDMVGQREGFARLEIALNAARKRRDTLGHILFDGPPGLGKTTFATVLPREMGVTMQIASGAALAAPKDLIPYLTHAEEGSVLYIDEIHRMPKA